MMESLFIIKYFDQHNDPHELIITEPLIAITHDRLIKEGFSKITVHNYQSELGEI